MSTEPLAVLMKSISTAATGAVVGDAAADRARTDVLAGLIGGSLWGDAWAYAVDAAQRTILFWDVLRQRGNQYVEHLEKEVPHVLSFATEKIMDGRELPRPANYGLVRIAPPPGVPVDRTKRPFVVVDPRAGHGPGIGGFKADSEIGVALAAGHPCYFIGFLPEPMPGQTIEDVLQAKACFLERVIELHPEADGKPAVVANCQAGWAVMLLSALRPELFGPIIVAGSPMSYWAGVRGANPMRYTGGLLGGSWLATATGDLSFGSFDGAWLVQNFENLNPSNTFWTKQYNLYANIDTEAARYLGFEKWWGGHVLLTGEEIQFIVDKLFVGNKLSTSQILMSDGRRVDLRNIRSPIVVFCSRGDNITPPQQALGWILDLYESVDEIRTYGQTIVYAVHETIGHLGIFVSGGVAKKEHSEFASNIDMIDVLPPGLYEAVLERKSADDPTSPLVRGDYIATFQARSLDDIRALGGNDEADERCFSTALRVSEVNASLYRLLAQPWMKAWSTEAGAAAMRQLHPARAQYELLSDRNIWMAPLKALAEQVRAQRRPCSKDNPFLKLQEQLSDQIVATLDRWGDARDWLSEQVFFAAYGSPFLQAWTGVSAYEDSVRMKPGAEPLHRRFVEKRIAELKSRVAEGGAREAFIRAALYVGLGRGELSPDERAFEILSQLREEHGEKVSFSAFKELLREQLFMLLIDEKGALDALPAMVSREPTARVGALRAALGRLGGAGKPLAPEQIERSERIAALLNEAPAESALEGVKAKPDEALKGRRRTPEKAEI